MMTLDDAIKHAEEVAEKEEEHINKTFATFGEDRVLFNKEENECKKCAEEHRQLAEWLKELKQFKESAIQLEKVKQAREDIENEVKFWSNPSGTKLLPSVKAVRYGKVNSYKHCLEILDKLIEESEEKE